MIISRQLTTESLSQKVPIIITFGLFYIINWSLRGFARSANPAYSEFINCLATRDIQKVKRYDFDLTHWPIEFDIQKMSKEELPFDPEITKYRGFRNPFYKFLGEGFARWMIMPGSLDLVKAQVSENLKFYRANLIEKENAHRKKIVINPDTFIDSILVDNRQKTANGNTLIICSEGNAGFYEFGLPNIPIKTGFSVLGWNRPGFGASSGYPSPDHERQAIYTLITYAKYILKFEKIYLFGWSIGGFPTTVGANLLTHDKKENLIDGIILDATFDEIKPMIGSVLPKILVPIGAQIVQQEWNLNVKDELLNYPGPVLFYRRVRDEIIATGGPNRPDTNRINWLVFEYVVKKFGFDKTKDKEILTWLWSYITSTEYSRLPPEGEKQKQLAKFLTERFIDLNKGHNDQFDPRTFVLP